MPRKPDPKVQVYEKRNGSSSFRVRVRVNGQQTTETFTSYAAAQAFCEMVKHDGAESAVQRRDEVDPKSTGYVPTLAELLTKHVAELTGVDDRTRDDYLSMARRSWLPILGRIRASNVTRADVARFVNARDGVVAPKTIKNEHSLLSSVLETAVREGYLNSNPARGTRLPRSGEEQVEEIRFLTYDEFDRLVAAVRETFPRYLPFVVLLFGTGLRFSEATALQVQDINPEARTLRVMRAWKRRRGGDVLGPPKSRASRRTIWVDDVVLDAVAPLRAGRGAQDWLFTTTYGNPIRHGNFYNRVWVPACVAAGLDPRPRIHDARHTHASWLIAAGMRLEIVQDRLGHDDYTTTRRVYARLMPDMRREAGIAASVAFARTSLGHGSERPRELEVRVDD